MCLTIDLKYHPTKIPLTAKEDIVVYKLIHDDNKSLYQNFEYAPNTLYRLRRN